MDEQLRAERDCIAALGLLAHNYLFFDPAIAVRQGKVTHRFGFNVHCCVVDNSDGEVLSIERNSIHNDDNPLQHAEQRAIRSALRRLREKRPRGTELTVEEYYKSKLFMGLGSTQSDYLRKGCSLYNTFDPCAMCAVTLLICYMKRIAYLVEDAKYAAFYDETKQAYFSNRESIKEKIKLEGSSKLIIAASELTGKLHARIAELLQTNVELIHVLDHCRDELGAAAELLRTASEADLMTDGEDRQCNRRTLIDFQRACNFPAT